MSEVAKAGGGLPANIGNMAAALAQSAGSAGATGAGELYLKMTKFGEWVYGAEETEVEEGATVAINPAGFQHGWTAWGSKARGNDGQNVGEVLVPATQPMPLEADLPNVNGDWSKCIAVQMKITDGEDEGVQLLWKANSLGARKAYASLLQAVVARIQEGSEAVVPLVKLVNDHYQHKTYGKIYTPVLDIVGWATMDGVATDDAPKVEDKTEQPEPEAKQEEEKPRRRRRRAS